MKVALWDIGGVLDKRESVVCGVLGLCCWARDHLLATTRSVSTEPGQPAPPSVILCIVFRLETLRVGVDPSHSASRHWRKQFFMRDASLDPPSPFGVLFS